jgi:hypothetical protein
MRGRRRNQVRMPHPAASEHYNARLDCQPKGWTYEIR